MNKQRLSGWAAAIFVISSSTSALADDGDNHFQIGVRTGYSVFAGKIYDPSSICFAGQCFSNDIFGTSHVVSGQVPLWLDAGYQITPNLMLGLYGQYGFVTLDSDCSGCSAHDIRFGIQAQYRFRPAGKLDPWLGLGVGYESLSLHQGYPEQQGFTQPVEPTSADSTFRGWELANLQGGVDFRLGSAFTLGPFLSVSLDEFTHQSIDYNYPGVANVDGSIYDKAVHEWITLGVKGSFGI